ncbi:MAG: T9SS type A sorting domain-containing protein [Bacteroidetes bacterium]|nr:T9SS type A sorting domain-containing protein [Bacteroidota bacterium]
MLKRTFQLLIISCFTLLTTSLNAQSLCGVYEKPNNPDPASLDEPYLLDRFGNIFTQTELNKMKIDAEKGQRILTGDFDIVFLNTFSSSQQQTILDVFTYLSGIVDLGPNGIPPVIYIRKQLLDPGVLGAGSPYFESMDCGRSKNRPLVAMLGGYDNDEISSVFHTGYIYLALGQSFHTTDNDPIGPNDFDLFTVVLHEALHVMGYSSLIGLDGSPNNSYYSHWDEFLYQTDIDDDVLVKEPESGVCCYTPKFNEQLSFPDDVDDSCGNNIFFRDNGSNIAQVNGDYGSTPLSDNLVANMLSHLDRCGSPGGTYVMHASLSAGETRRQMEQEEIDILYAMGYPEEGSSNLPCELIAATDYITLFGDGSILIEELLENDIFPNNATITFPAYSGTIWSNATVTINATSISITNPEYGNYNLYYSIEGCDGDCAVGRVNILHLNQLPDCGGCVDNELFCHGSFEDFLPQIGYGIEPYFGQPYCTTDNGVRSSPDIYLEESTGNQVVFLGGSSLIDYFLERMYIPLSQPFAPECKALVCFDAATYNCSEPLGITLFGTNTPHCSGLWESSCDPGAPYYCLGDSEPIECNGSNPNSDLINSQHPLYPPEYPNNPGVSVRAFTEPLNLKSYCMEIANESAESWDYLVVSRLVEEENGIILLDNLSITSECCEEVNPCGIEIVETCKETSVVLTVLQNGVPIPMYNADCCVSWSGIPGLPTYGCPPGPGAPAQNFNNIHIKYGEDYCVEIVCPDCEPFIYCGITGETCEGGGPAIATGPIGLAPNPATDQLKLFGESLKAGQLWNLYSINGQIQYQGIIQYDGLQEIDLSALHTGLYYITINQPDGSLLTVKRFIKQ